MKIDKSLRNKNRSKLSVSEKILKEKLIELYNNGENFIDLQGSQGSDYLRLIAKDKWFSENTIEPTGTDYLCRRIEALNYKDERDKYIHVITVQFKDDPLF